MSYCNNPFGVIFDMDGVIVDSMPFHEQSWKELFRKHGVQCDDTTMRQQVYGRLGREIVMDLFPKPLTHNQADALVSEKEAIYRDIFEKAVHATAGLEEFLKELDRENIPRAIATSATPDNVRFILEKTGLRKYFPLVVDATMVTKGKPDPEIFLLAANLLHITPSHCVVFEDAHMGIEAAQRAGMKVIALATTHTKKDLEHADRVVKDFTTVRIANLAQLII